jgi:hypothetical protein
MTSHRTFDRNRGPLGSCRQWPCRSNSEPSGSEVDACSSIWTGKRRPADFGELIEPCRRAHSGYSPEQRCFSREVLVARVVHLGQFGVDGAQAGIGEPVLDVPLEALAEFGAEFLEPSCAAGDLVFGLADVVGESVDLLQGRCLLFAAVTRS